MLGRDQLLRIEDAIKNKNSAPLVLAFRLSPVCNLGCLYCKGGFTGTKKDKFDTIIGLDLLKSIFSEARGMGVREIDLNILEGEPFTHPDIIEIVKSVKANGFKGAITTNGSLLEEVAAETMASCNWDIIFISIDSLNPKTQYCLRPALCGKDYLHNIIDFIEMMDNKETKIEIYLNVVVSRLNYKEIPNLIDFFGRHKSVTKINLLRLINPGLENRLWKEISITGHQEEEFRSLMVPYYGRDSFIRGIGQWEPNKEGISEKNQRLTSCFFNYFTLSIDYNGEVVQCPQMRNRIGANVKNKPLKDIWNTTHATLRQRLYKDASCMNECCSLLRGINNCISKFLSEENPDMKMP